MATAFGGAGTLLLLGPTASAAPDPCAASQVARTIGTVANNTGLYLETHPDTNQVLTRISQQAAGPQSLVALKTYFDANPDAAKDLQTIQQPLSSLSTKCKLPISLPQVLSLIQTAQQGGAAQVTGTGPAPGPVAAVPAATGTTSTPG
ncbi:hemophore [Mycobacterium sp. ACS4331]|nr:hemophore [Mycobacterium sp. ACS4331]